MATTSLPRIYELRLTIYDLVIRGRGLGGGLESQIANRKSQMELAEKVRIRCIQDLSIRGSAAFRPLGRE